MAFVQLAIGVGLTGCLRELGVDVKLRPPAPHGERVAGVFETIDEAGRIGARTAGQGRVCADLPVRQPVDHLGHDAGEKKQGPKDGGMAGPAGRVDQIAELGADQQRERR